MTAGAVSIPVGEWQDIVTARATGRALAAELGFDTVDQVRLATAISEIVRNAIQYAGSAECLLQDASDSQWRRVDVTVRDAGPGIADLARALQDGYSTSGGLGAGLPGCSRLMSDFRVDSSAQGTTVHMSLVVRR